MKPFLPSLDSINKGLIIGAIIAAAIGSADAIYLTIVHFMHIIPPCTIAGCETVLTSAYSAIAGVPVALLGALYYVSVLVALVLYLDIKKPILLNYVIVVSSLGFLATLGFIYLQAFVIHAWCQYCLLSAATTTVLFIISIVMVKKSRKPAQISMNL